MTNLALRDLIEQQQLENRIKEEQSATQFQFRKDDARRKILVGAYVLDKYNAENKLDDLIQELDQFLFRPGDRILFGLPPKTEEITIPEASALPTSISK